MESSRPTLFRRLAVAACLVLPIALLHARAVAEILIAAIDVLFLLHTVLTRDAAWLRSRFAVAALLWWGWLVVCSAHGSGGLLPALLAVRLPVLALAVGDWVLAGDSVPGLPGRRALWMMLAASAAWIGVEAWEQYLTGSNLFGQPRYVDGALTGPFAKPRAGPAFILLLFPALIPAAGALLLRPRLRARLGGVALSMLAALTMVLIGQRMPTALMVLGLAISALLVPRLRVALLCAGAAGAVLVAALPWVSPATAAKLIAQTTGQLAHFGQSPYGLIFVRAITVFQLDPWFGQGFDGFRRGCHSFWTMHGVAWLGVPDLNFNGGQEACNLHPHNYYLEALDDAGLPGLGLFCAMVGTALARLARGILADPPLLQVGAFVGALVALWPLATTSAVTSMPNGGWVFLILGLGFAASGVLRRRKGEGRQGLLF